MNIERNNRLSGEIVFVKEAVHHLGKVIPPQRIVKCSLPLEPIENTGFNAIQKCVLCSFLPEYLHRMDGICLWSMSTVISSLSYNVIKTPTRAEVSKSFEV